jgi:ribosomal-protein-alanine N-acetyltransferase
MSILDRMLDRAVTRPISIDPLRAKHIGQIMAIETAAYPKPWSAQVFHDELREARDGRRLYLVARRRHRVLGYAGLMFVTDRRGATVSGSEAHVTNIAVHPDERRTGVATRLLIELAKAAIARGCQAWTLEVRATSLGAQELYRRFGFVPAGIRKNYYEANTDAIVMWCHDIAGPAYAKRLEELQS